MRLVADLHTHTVASGHAYSTILENAKVAAEKCLEMIAVTDHGPGMPGAPHDYHFSNQRVLPDEIFGVKILAGIEANVMNRDGSLDLDAARLTNLDIVLAGLHTLCAPYGTVEQNTEMLINTMRNPLVDIIVHPGNPEYLIDEEKVVRAAMKYDIALEINNSSLTFSRQGSFPHCEKIVALTKAYGAKIIVGTDSHFAWNVGDFAAAEELLQKYDFSPTQVINTSVKSIKEYLSTRHGRR